MIPRTHVQGYCNYTVSLVLTWSTKDPLSKIESNVKEMERKEKENLYKKKNQNIKLHSETEYAIRDKNTT